MWEWNDGDLREWNRGRIELGRWGLEGFKILIGGFILGELKKEMFVKGFACVCDLVGFVFVFVLFLKKLAVLIVFF